MGKILSYMLLELIVAPNDPGQTFKFGTSQSSLISSAGNGDIGIRSIEIFTSESVPVGTTNVPNASFAAIQKGFLNLKYLGKDLVQNIPLVKLLHLKTAAAGAYYSQGFGDELDDLQIDWANSTVNYPAPPASVTSFQFMFGVNYGMYPVGFLAQVKKARGGK